MRYLSEQQRASIFVRDSSEVLQLIRAALWKSHPPTSLLPIVIWFALPNTSNLNVSLRHSATYTQTLATKRRGTMTHQQAPVSRVNNRVKVLSQKQAPNTSQLANHGCHSITGSQCFISDSCWPSLRMLEICKRCVCFATNQFRRDTLHKFTP